MSKEFREVLECLFVLGIVLLIGHYGGQEIHDRTAPLVRAVGSKCNEIALFVLAAGGLGCGLASALALTASTAIATRCGVFAGRLVLLTLLVLLMSLVFYSAIPGFVSAVWLLCAGGFLLFSKLIKG